MKSITPVLLTAALLLASAPDAQAADADGHAADAAWDKVPSHVFRLAPRRHELPQLSVHFGLLQPVLFRGFNAALDLRWRRLLVSYSHGQGLDYSASPSLGLTPSEASAGMRLVSPWTTGGGVGVVLLDELYVMADFKRHRYEASLDGDTVAYTTTSIGAEVGWRFFAWRGFFVQPMLRYWPNVHTTLPGGSAQVGGVMHAAKDLNFFANVTVGWAFEI
jgi:hypothetical protein